MAFLYSELLMVLQVYPVIWKDEFTQMRKTPLRPMPPGFVARVSLAPWMLALESMTVTSWKPVNFWLGVVGEEVLRGVGAGLVAADGLGEHRVSAAVLTAGVLDGDDVALLHLVHHGDSREAALGDDGVVIRGRVRAGASGLCLALCVSEAVGVLHQHGDEGSANRDRVQSILSAREPLIRIRKSERAERRARWRPGHRERRWR